MLHKYRGCHVCIGHGIPGDLGSQFLATHGAVPSFGSTVCWKHQLRDGHLMQCFPRQPGGLPDPGGMRVTPIVVWGEILCCLFVFRLVAKLHGQHRWRWLSRRGGSAPRQIHACSGYDRRWSTRRFGRGPVYPHWRGHTGDGIHIIIYI